MSRAVLIEALAKALQRTATREAMPAGGLLASGKPPLLHRLSFLLRSMNDDRLHDVGRYMTTRVPGGATPGGRRRIGEYSGAYVRPAPDPLDDDRMRLFGIAGLGGVPVLSLREVLAERMAA